MGNEGDRGVGIMNRERMNYMREGLEWMIKKTNENKINLNEEKKKILREKGRKGWNGMNG